MHIVNCKYNEPNFPHCNNQKRKEEMEVFGFAIFCFIRECPVIKGKVCNWQTPIED